MSSLARFSEKMAFVCQVWEGVPLAEAEGRDSCIGPDGVLDLEGVRNCRISCEIRVALWQEAVLGLLKASAKRKTDLERSERALVSLEERYWKRKYCLAFHQRRVFSAVKCWLQESRKTYANGEWDLVFNGQDPLVIVDTWLTHIRTLSKECKVRRTQLVEQWFNSSRLWLGVLKDNALKSTQLFKPKDIERDLKKRFRRIDLKPVARSLAEMFGSSADRLFQTSSLTKYLFFKALGQDLFATPGFPFQELHLDEEINRDAFLISILQNPTTAAALVMTLNDADWQVLIESLGLVQEGVLFSLKSLTVLLYQVGSYVSEDPRTLLRKTQFFNCILAEALRGRLADRCAVLSALESKIVEGLSIELVAILYMSNLQYKSAREDCNQQLLAGLRDLTGFSYARLLQECFSISKVRGLEPFVQIKVLQSLLKRIQIEETLVALEPALTKSDEGNELAFVLVIALADRWDVLRLTKPFLDSWFKAAAASTDSHPETSRAYLRQLSGEVLSKLGAFFFYVEDFSGALLEFNIPLIYQQMPLDPEGSDVEALAPYQPLIRQLPPLAIYACTRMYGADYRYFQSTLKVLPFLTLPQASMFFAGISNRASPQLAQVVDTIFEPNGGFGISGGTVVSEDIFIVLLKGMSKSQQYVVFQRFREVWGVRFNRMQDTLMEIFENTGNEPTAEQIRGLFITFVGLKNTYRLLSLPSHLGESSMPLGSLAILPRILRMYKGIHPEEYSVLATQFAAVLDSEIVRILDLYFTETEDAEGPADEGSLEVDEYLLCFNPVTVSGLQSREINSAGEGMALLPSYGIRNDADLARIVGSLPYQLQLAESFEQLKMWLGVEVGSRSGGSRDVSALPFNPKVFMDNWISHMGESRYNTATLSRLFGADVALPPHILDKVLRPLVIFDDNLRYLLTPQDARTAVLQFIDLWHQDHFLAVMTRYLDQTRDLARVWKALPYGGLKDCPPGIDLFNLSYLLLGTSSRVF